MTTATGGGDRSWLVRARMWFGHYSQHLTVAMMAIYGTLALIQPQGPILVRFVVFEAIPQAVFVVVVVSVAFCSPYHDRNLCLREVVAAPLLDPAGAVHKHRRALRSFHHRRRTLGVVALSVAALVVASAFVASWWGRVVYVVALTVSIVNVYIGRTHQRLRPWCPWCRRDGWSEGGLIPEPSPDPGVKVTT